MSQLHCSVPASAEAREKSGATNKEGVGMQQPNDIIAQHPMTTNTWDVGNRQDH